MSGQLVTPPDQCLVMVGFNQATAGPEAIMLTQALQEAGFPTFCTAVYCPSTGGGGNWRKMTITGVQHCRVFIPLMTHGWQKSCECVWEFERVLHRAARREVTIIPIMYEDFDEGYDEENDMFVAQIGRFIQWIYHRDKSWVDLAREGVKHATQACAEGLNAALQEISPTAQIAIASLELRESVEGDEDTMGETEEFQGEISAETNHSRGLKQMVLVITPSHFKTGSMPIKIALNMRTKQFTITGEDKWNKIDERDGHNVTSFEIREGEICLKDRNMFKLDREHNSIYVTDQELYLWKLKRDRHSITGRAQIISEGGFWTTAVASFKVTSCSDKTGSG